MAFPDVEGVCKLCIMTLCFLIWLGDLDIKFVYNSSSSGFSSWVQPIGSIKLLLQVLFAVEYLKIVGWTFPALQPISLYFLSMS